MNGRFRHLWGVDDNSRADRRIGRITVLRFKVGVETTWRDRATGWARTSRWRNRKLDLIMAGIFGMRARLNRASGDLARRLWWLSRTTERWNNGTTLGFGVANIVFVVVVVSNTSSLRKRD
jgi:hypothetical protein